MPEFQEDCTFGILNVSGVCVSGDCISWVFFRIYYILILKSRSFYFWSLYFRSLYFWILYFQILYFRIVFPGILFSDHISGVCISGIFISGIRISEVCISGVRISRVFFSAVYFFHENVTESHNKIEIFFFYSWIKWHMQNETFPCKVIFHLNQLELFFLTCFWNYKV